MNNLVLEPESEDRLKAGDLVQSYKRETVKNPMSEYLYKIIAIMNCPGTDERVVVYQALGNFSIFTKPYNVFMDEVNHKQNPDIHQKYMFEKYNAA